SLSASRFSSLRASSGKRKRNSCSEEPSSPRSSSTGSGGNGAAEERPAKNSRAIPERKANERHEVLRVIRRSCMGGTFTSISGRTVANAGRRRLCHLEYDSKRAIIPVCTLVQR